MECSTPHFPIFHHHPDSCPLSQWCHLTISSSVVPFCFCLQSFPASGSLPVSQPFASGGQSIGASASASVLSMNIQSWFQLGLTGLIFLQSKKLSSVFSNTTVQKHQLFNIQPSLLCFFYTVFSFSALIRSLKPFFSTLKILEWEVITLS